MSVDYDPLSPTTWDDPYPVYRALRDDAPVHHAPQTDIYCLSRYDDVVFAFKSPELFSSRTALLAMSGDRWKGLGLRDVFEIARFAVRSRANPLRFRSTPPEGLITSDPPRHDVLRAIVNRGFTPRRIQVLEDRMREITAACMAKLGRREDFDAIRDLAIPLPVTIIAEMLGVAPERQEDFKRWSDELISAISGSQRNEKIGALLRAMGELNAYLRPIVAERRRRPADDLISVLVDPRHEDTLSEQDVSQFIALILVAGNETTTHLIGNAVTALLDHPEQIARVQTDPGLVPSLIEETLRYDTPVQVILRTTTREVKVAGTAIPAGANVALLIGSANRDERVFEEPDRFDVARDTKRHIAFGFGVHFCLGASLARLEAHVALEALVPELPRLRRRDAATTLVDSFMVRGPKSLPLVAA